LGIDVGENWDDLLTRLDAALALDAEPFDRLRLLSAKVILRVARGEPRDDDFAADQALADSAGNWWAPIIEGDRLLLADRLDDAWDVYAEFARKEPADAFNALVSGARAAVWKGDVERVRSSVRALDEDPTSGPWADATRVAFRSAIDAFEGRTAGAVTGYLQAIRMIGDVGANFDRARFIVDATMTLGPVPELHELIEEARALFVRLRARPWLDALERAIADGAAPTDDRPAKMGAASLA
jgi:hypothetical protein